MGNLEIRFTLVTIILAFCFGTISLNAQVPHDADILVSITTDLKLLKSDSTNYVDLRIENRGQKPISLEYLPVLQIVDLDGKQDDTFETNGFYAFVPTSSEFSDQSIDQLQPGNPASIRVNLASLKWARRGSSTSPSDSLFDIAGSGTYFLRLLVKYNRVSDGKTKLVTVNSDWIKFEVVSPSLCR